MSFCARTAEDISKGKVSGGEIITIDGVTFGPRMKTYAGVVDPEFPQLVDSKGRPFGAPTRAMKLDNRLWLETRTGLPWPGSASDRFAKGKCADGMANALAGAKSPFGAWPDARERTCQSNDRMMREHPVARAEALIKQRPFTEGEKAVIRARAQAMATGADPDAFETDGMDVELLMGLDAAAAMAKTPGVAAVHSAPPSEVSRKRRAAAG